MRKERQIFPVGEWVQHFKRENILLSQNNRYKYVYEIEGYGTDTETGNKVVIYMSLENYKLWVRPLDIFMSEVDKEKYPNIKQKYRFEKYKFEKIIN